MELAGSFQCFGIVFFVIATSATFFNDVDFAVVFPSTLAPIIVTAITPLITLVAVVAEVIALVAAVKIVAPTTVVAVVVTVWGVVGAWNPCCFFDNYLSYFLAVARSAVTDQVSCEGACPLGCRGSRG